MRIGFLAVGDELLDGRYDDTNAGRVARALRTRGRRLSGSAIVRDDGAEIRSSLVHMASQFDFIIMSGGLGATNDDVTREAVGEWLARPLVEHPDSLRRVKDFLAERRIAFSPGMQRHVLIPEGSVPIANPVGLATGFLATAGSTRVVVLPGVPAELEAMLPAVLDLLDPSPRVWYQHRFVLVGIGEQVAEQKLLEAQLSPAIAIGLLPQTGPLEISLSTTLGQNALEPAIMAARRALQEHLVCENRSIPEAVGDALLERGETLAIAESCTGGLLASLLTDVPGASAYVLAGVVSYSNEAKLSLLSVAPGTLAEHGAVSEATVLEMADGARTRCGANWGLATSGIAGPGGGSADKPVGTVHVAVVGPSGSAHRKLFFPRRSRVQIKRFAAFGALALLMATLRGARTEPSELDALTPRVGANPFR